MFKIILLIVKELKKNKYYSKSATKTLISYLLVMCLYSRELLKLQQGYASLILA
jgi:hypothetical protein